MKGRVAAVGIICLAVVAVLWWRSSDEASVAKPDTTIAADDTLKTAPQRRAGAPRDGANREMRSLDVLLDDDPVGTLRLEGQVIDASQDPVAGAMVSIDSNPPRTTRSTEDGSFFFDKLVGRQYRVVARDETSFAGPVTVRLTETNDPVILTLKPAAEVDITVRAAADGRAIAGAEVALRSIDVASAQTDEQGVARVRGVAPGGYAVVVNAPGFAPNHSRLRIASGTEKTAHEVTLSRGAPVRGMVQTAGGKPVVAARVVYRGVSNWEQSADMRYDGAVTDASGQFEFPALPAGSFRFVARADGYSEGTSEITVLDGQTTAGPVVIRVEDGAVLSGVVIDSEGAPAASARIRVSVATESMSWQRPRQVFSDEEGAFEMRNLPAKTVEVLAQHERGSSESLSETLTVGKETSITLELIHNGTISGVVVDSAGEPIEGAQVSGWPSFGGGGRRGRRRGIGFARELTDAGGRFTLRGLAEGTYSLRATPPGSAGRSRMFLRDNIDAEVGSSDVRIVLPADGAVTGKITFDDGEAPAAFTVGVGFGTPTPFSSSKGEFELGELPPRTYNLTIRGVGFDDRRVADVKVEAGETTDIGTITVQRGRRIVGRIVDSSGNGVEGALVRAGRQLFGDGSSSKSAFSPPWARNAKETRSDEDGAFVISGLGRGVLSVVAEHEEAGRSRIVTVGVGQQATELNLALEPWGALEGTVRKGGEPAGEVIVSAAMVESPQVSYGVQSGADGTFRFDRLGPGLYKVSAMTGRSPMRGFSFFRKEVDIVSEKTATVDIDIDAGDVTLTVALDATNAEATGFAFLHAVRGELAAKTFRELLLAVAAVASDRVFQQFSIRGNPAELEGLSPGDYTICVTPYPLEVSGMADTLAYGEREGDSLLVSCHPVKVNEQAEQSVTIEVTIPNFVPDTDG